MQSLVALLAGIFVAFLTVYSVRLSNQERSPWAYPLILSLYPVFYIAFALLGGSHSSVINEVLYAIPFFLICIMCARNNLRLSVYLMSFGYILHGLYDAFHHLLFLNAGAPIWWPEFCGAVDIAIGLYLFFSASKFPEYRLVTEKE